jgi:L-fucono-1,5-lactonase
MIAVVDSHVHVWSSERADYAWLGDVPQLPRTVELDEFWPEQAALGVRQVVLVQAADNVADTENMLRTARLHGQVAGVVAWVPLRDARAADALLERWRDEPVVGVRHLVHRDPDPDLLRDPTVHETLDLLGERGLTFDVCAETPRLLGLVPDLAVRHPGLTLVVDHLGKPPIRDRGWEPWASLLAAAAEAPNVVAKLSGLSTAAAVGWTSADLAPYVEHALDVFGPRRLMYGGDWPFALLAASSYTEVWDGVHGTIESLADDDQRAVLAGTACRVYGLSPRAEPLSLERRE